MIFQSMQRPTSAARQNPENAYPLESVDVREQHRGAPAVGASCLDTEEASAMTIHGYAAVP
jgi:hypothetical protein